MTVVKKIYLGVILFFLYAPIIVLMVFSFNSSQSMATWEGFTLDWYRALLNNREVRRALENTLLIGVFSTLIATTIGTAAAVGLDRLGRKSKKVIISVSSLPVMMPDIVTGICLMMLYHFVIRSIGRGQLGFNTLLLSHIMFNVPYVILCVMPKLRTIDPNLYEAALDLGSRPLRAFVKVILPEIWPGVVTGAMLAFTLSVDDFMVSFFTTGPGVENLSILIFSMTRVGINPMINALSTLIFMATLLLLTIIYLRDRRANKKKEELQ